MMMKFLKELYTASNAPRRNWRGIFIALLIIGFVILMVSLAILILSKYDQGPRVKGNRITIEDILSNRFAAIKYNATWISNDELVYMDYMGGLSVLNLTTRTPTIFMPNNSFRQLDAGSFELSSDRRYVLLVHDTVQITQYKKTSKYSIFDSKLKHHYGLLMPGSNKARLQHVSWRTESNSLVIIAEDNNIYYRPSIDDRAVVQLTNDGEQDLVFNGVTDPVYEEILESSTAVWMSPDGNKLLYGMFNDTGMDELFLTSYSYYKLQDGSPKIKKVRYSRAGRPLPEASLFLIDRLSNIRSKSKSPTKLKITPPTNLTSKLAYFTSVHWIDSNHICVTWMDRVQQTLITSICRQPTYICEVKHQMEVGPNEWIVHRGPPVFSKEKDSFLSIEPVLDGNFGRFHHIHKVNVSKEKINPVTFGQYEVHKIIAWDQTTHYVYFLAVPMTRSQQRHLYRVANGDSGQHNAFECLSCLIKPKKEIVGREEVVGNCSYVNAYPSPGTNWIIIECLGPGLPRTHILNTKTKHVWLWEDNANLQEQAFEAAMPHIKTFKVGLDDDSIATVRLMLPPVWRKDDEIKYPLLVEAFGSFGSQSVRDVWEVTWPTYLSSHGDVMYARVDAAGAPNQGLRVLHKPKHKIGTPESHDLITVVKFLLSNLPFLDPHSVGIWGWGYGGYVSLRTLAINSSFSCGIAVAPVTNWIHYDATFTEKYMGLPNFTDIYREYKLLDFTEYAEGLRGKSTYIIHGSQDTKVLPDQTMFLSRELALKDIYFQQQIYTDEGHTLSGVKRHLYRTMEIFFGKCFKEWMTLEGAES